MSLHWVRCGLLVALPLAHFSHTTPYALALFPPQFEHADRSPSGSVPGGQA